MIMTLLAPRRVLSGVLALAMVLFVLALGTAPARAIEVTRVTSPGAIEAWLVEDHTNPILAMRIIFRGGAALDPPGKGGLANLVSALLDEGAGELDSQAFQGRLEDLAITLRFDAGRDMFGGRLRTLSENRDAAFELLRLALTAPRFDDEPVMRIRSQLLAHLRRESEDPSAIASKRISATFFPAHPYGRPVDGSPESLQAITTGDLRRFVGERLARDNLVIGVVGDITPAELAALLDSTFGALPMTAASWAVADTEPRATGETIVVRKPVPQSSITFGHKGVRRDDPDFYAAYVLNHVLGGGGFTSRLYGEVREKRGLAYSISTGLYPLDHAAMLLGGAGTANARVGETLTQVRAIWRDLSRKGMTEKELADAKTFLTGSFPLRFSSSPRIAAMLAGMQVQDLGIDYLDRRNGYIEAVTLADVNRVAAKLLDPEALTVVVVGEPDGVVTTQ